MELFSPDRPSAAVPYDVAIIGAGLAGLTAACELRDRKIVILEQTSRVGGRVFTQVRNGCTYDLGAVFAYPQQLVEIELNASPLRSESDQIGLFDQGQLHVAKGVAGCLNQLSLEAAEKQALVQCYQNNQASVCGLSPRLQAVLNAFFQVIHPGAIWAYRPERKYDATRKFDTAHHECGNGELLAQLLGQSQATLITDAEVKSVRQNGDQVEIAYVRHGEAQRLRLPAAIVTAPAPVAAQILVTDNPHTQAFLHRLRFAGGISVAVGLNHTRLPEFGYLVAPESPLATVIQQRDVRQHRTILLIYYTGDEAARLAACSAAAIVDQTLTALQQLSLDVPNRADLLFHDVQHWPAIGPIIDQAYDHWSLLALQPEPGIFLAGDYTAFDPVTVMPYGLAAAIVSGKRAAADVRQKLDRDAAVGRFQPRYLVDVYRYQMDQKAPVYLGKHEEGNIALNGLVLEAEPDNERLKAYLLEASRDDLWEWQAGFGITLEDSALVMAGLLAAGVPAETLQPSVQKLVDWFYDDESGAFCTIARQRDRQEMAEVTAGGQAAYWVGPSIDATAHAAWLLHHLAPQTYAEQMQRSMAYLQGAQSGLGHWPSRWFPSHVWTTWFATRLLLLNASEFASTLQRSLAFLRYCQAVDGSWNQSVIDTSLALLTMAHLASESPPLMQRAQQWLLNQCLPDGHWPGGEPVLYYWFELENGLRLFHHCVDKGAVATAWARLALRAYEAIAPADVSI